MAGTKKGGELAAKTNKLRHGPNFYAQIGKMGGRKSRNGGFAANRDLARIAGAKGGKKSRRGKKASITQVNASVSDATASDNTADKIAA